MDDLPGQHRSLWSIDVDTSAYPALAEDISVDVAVVGGRITGVTTAVLCKDAGMTVAVTELRLHHRRVTASVLACGS